MTGVFYLIAWIDLSFLLMAAGFGSDVAMGGSPITPELYGPEVYAIPALTWVAIQAVSAILGGAGALMVSSGLARSGAALCGFGNTVLSALFLLFGMMSARAEMGALLHYASLYPAMMVTGAAAVTAGRVFLGGAK